MLAWLLTSRRSAEDAAAYRFHQGQVATGIPFELNSNKIYLQVRVNGGEQRWFILDSGCPVTAVDVELARQLQLPMRNQRTVGGAGEGSTFLCDTVLQKLTLPGLDYVPATAWAIGVNQPVSRFEGRRIDGLLGLDFLEQFVVRIDYAGRKLDVYEPKAFKPRDTDVSVPVEKGATIMPCGHACDCQATRSCKLVSSSTLASVCRPRRCKPGRSERWAVAWAAKRRPSSLDSRRWNWASW